MQVEGTKAAFEAMIKERGIYKRLGVDTSTVANWKAYLREGKSISLDKMEEMLFRSGAQIVTNKVWRICDKYELNPWNNNLSSLKPSDVRIGNYVRSIYNGGTTAIVSAEIIINLEHPESTTYQPILLSEEWLWDFKFEKKEGGVANSWHIGHNPITKDWLMEVVQIVDDNRFFYRNSHFKLKYVHQLQNLYFALTGEELTIGALQNGNN
ncbi:hypothetical protein N180_02870 [Pedobacter antarcticus 4BY]|uniref:Uncharacterized protein n=2 Tax=Pedobacter antarcticus TaxID=34086 RepID=A0A081PKI5_9SPHI|nr:hypothetical protein [Pedobacter antarcticus]KEQ31208.1 hypothetical protein N180_02870 [Pedobacter antarcticus 4BY]SFE54990.1 hypothetical protein SAMN03003324_00862 [Pedobacter antarcticus]